MKKVSVKIFIVYIGRWCVSLNLGILCLQLEESARAYADALRRDVARQAESILDAALRIETHDSAFMSKTVAFVARCSNHRRSLVQTSRRSNSRESPISDSRDHRHNRSSSRTSYGICSIFETDNYLFREFTNSTSEILVYPIIFEFSRQFSVDIFTGNISP